MDGELHPEWFQKILDRLPPKDLKDVLWNESEFYGAADLISAAMGFSSVPRSHTAWTHGWVYFPCPFVESFVWSVADTPRVLTQREDQAEFLRANNVRAIAAGAPILYVEDRYRAEPLPKSLLVMPTHSLDETRHAPDEAAYFEEFDAIRGHFEYVAACLHPSCLTKNLWVENFRQRGIPVVTGADVRDRNALRRQVALFTSFTHVTSNGVGSHLPYAAYHGCRISVFGPPPSFRASDLAEQPFYKQNPHILAFNVDLVERGYIREKFGSLHCSPERAGDSRAWAGKELGLASRRAPEEVARLLGWRSTATPAEEVFERKVLSLGWETPDPELIRLKTEILELERSRNQARERVKKLKDEKNALRERNERLTTRVATVESALQERDRRQRRGFMDRLRKKLEAFKSP